MTGDTHVVHLVQAVSRGRDDLWQACGTPEGLAGWYADVVTGTIEAGGSVRLEWPDLGASVDLDVVECSPGERVAFRNGDSRVTLVVSAGAVALTHDGLGEKDDLPGFRSSWRVALAHLCHGLEAHPGRTRRASWIVRRARTSAELAHLCFTETSALEAWLGQPARMGEEGGEHSITVGDGRRLAGRVLVREPGHDVVLTLEGKGHGSLLSLRTLPSPRGDAERLVAACWSRWNDLREREREVDEAVERDTLHALNAAMDRLTTILSRRGDA